MTGTPSTSSGALRALSGLSPTARGSAALAVALGIGALHALRFRDFFADDSYISLRYSQRLAQGMGLTWTDGERVEGYTDLLWVLLGAIGEGAGADEVLWMRLWGMLGLLAGIAAVSVDPLTLRPDARRAATGGLALALCGGPAVWAMGGLEQTFLGGLMACVLVLLARALEGRARSAQVAAVLLVLAVWTRADALVLWVGVVLGVAASGGFRLLPSLVIFPAAAIAAQHFGRYSYYGEWIPNTARVKVSFTAARAELGGGYVVRGVGSHAVLLALAGAGATWARSRPRWVLPAVVVGTWGAYVAFVGGDLFKGYRQLVPILPALALLVAELGPPARKGQGAAFAFALLVHGTAQLGDRNFTDATEHWALRIEPLGLLLRRAWGDADPLLAVDAAGALPYHTRFRALDMLGLTDAWIAKHPPPNFGKRGLGHDLGDGDYVWRREPDVIAFNSGFGAAAPQFTGGRQLVARPDFGHRYQRILVRVPSKRGELGNLFVRRDGGPLGVQRSPGRVRVPGYFFATDRRSPAVPDDEGVLGVQGAGMVRGILLPAGTWRARGPEGSAVAVHCGGEAGQTITTAQSMRVRITLQSSTHVPWVDIVGAQDPAAPVCGTVPVPPPVD